MKVRDIFVFIFLSVFAGIAIAMGATAYLLSCNMVSGIWGKMIGAFLFSLGMLAVITFGLKLFTGMAAGIPTMGVKKLWQLPVCLLGNILGVALFALFVKYSFIYETVVAQAQETLSAKLSSDMWALNTIGSSIMCGLLITFSVWGPRYALEKRLSVTLCVILPIMVFVFCGFDHCIANIYYMCISGQISLEHVGYVAIAVAGNTLGGVLFPLVAQMMKKG